MRHLMEPDPEAEGPYLDHVYVVIIFLLLVVIALGHYAQ